MTFLHPWFLLGLAAVVVPIILHLFELRRAQRVLFTNVDYLQEVKSVVSNQRKLQHLLVLILRIVFIASLALLFAQPVVRNESDRETGDASKEATFIVDNSPSMGVVAADGTTLAEQGHEDIKNIAGQLPHSARHRLIIGNSSKPRVSTNDVAELLGISQTSAASVGVASALRKIANDPTAEQSQVFVVSDFQRSGIDVAEQLKQSKRRGQVLHLVSLTPKPTANVCVDSVYTTEEYVRAGVEIPLYIRLRNGGNQPAQDVQVRVFAGPRQVGAYRVELAAGGITTNTVRVKLTSGEAQPGRIEIEDQPVNFDNTHFFALSPADKIRVADISSGAVATRRLYPNEAVFAYKELQAGSLTEAALNQTDVVVMQGKNDITNAQREFLRQFVEQGGMLVVAPAMTASSRAGYERLFADLNLPFIRWNTIGNTTAQQELAAPDRQNPFFKDVFAEQTRQPDMPSAIPLLTWERSTVDVLKFRDGAPFLSGFKSGAGMVYVFASALEAGTSPFANHPLFVPVMYRLATLSKGQNQALAYRLTDRTIVLRMPAIEQAGEPLFKLSNDSATFIPVQQVRDGRLYLQLPPEMRLPGLYQLSLNGKALTTLAFNVDKKESELARYTADELRQLATAYPNVHVYESGAGRSAAAQFGEERRGTPLWRYFLVGALLCLLGEVLVLRFARQQVAAPVAA